MSAWSMPSRVKGKLNRSTQAASVGFATAASRTSSNDATTTIS